MIEYLQSVEVKAEKAVWVVVVVLLVGEKSRVDPHHVRSTTPDGR